MKVTRVGKMGYLGEKEDYIEGTVIIAISAKSVVEIVNDYRDIVIDGKIMDNSSTVLQVV